MARVSEIRKYLILRNSEEPRQHSGAGDPRHLNFESCSKKLGNRCRKEKNEIKNIKANKVCKKSGRALKNHFFGQNCHFYLRVAAR